MSDCSWTPLIGATCPLPGEVLVVSTSLDLPPTRLAQLQAMLSPDEKERAARFATLELHDRFTAGRGLLRELLATALGADARLLRFVYGPHGKPALEITSLPEQCAPALTFNASHSQGRALFALARGQAVGVDIESVRARNSEGIAERFFTPDENAVLRALGNEDQSRRAFFALWSAKEAFIKATGLGLSASLSSFAFEFTRITALPGLEESSLLAPTRLRWHRDDPTAATRWAVQPLAPAIGFSGSVVTEGAPSAVRMHFWDATLAPVHSIHM